VPTPTLTDEQAFQLWKKDLPKYFHTVFDLMQLSQDTLTGTVMDLSENNTIEFREEQIERAQKQAAQLDQTTREQRVAKPETYEKSVAKLGRRLGLFHNQKTVEAPKSEEKNKPKIR
jgi:hypothetical protein